MVFFIQGAKTEYLFLKPLATHVHSLSVCYSCTKLCPLRREHWKLLSSLKTTVEGLLSTNNPNVWSRYGGLQRLHKDMSGILSHGLKNEQVLNSSHPRQPWSSALGKARFMAKPKTVHTHYKPGSTKIKTNCRYDKLYKCVAMMHTRMNGSCWLLIVDCLCLHFFRKHCSV